MAASQILLLFVFVSVVNCFSSGPPQSQCVFMLPGHGGNGETSTSPYAVEFSASTGGYRPGQTYDVKIKKKSSTSSNFRGFMCQVRQAGSTSAIGEFTQFDGGKAHNLFCTSSKGAVTHMNGNQVSQQSFKWKAPSSSGLGVLNAVCTVVVSKPTFWVAVGSASASEIVQKSTTSAPTTLAVTTLKSTTRQPTTILPTTPLLTTEIVTTQVPSTAQDTTQAATTAQATTQSSTTLAVTTQLSTTVGKTTPRNLVTTLMTTNILLSTTESRSEQATTTTTVHSTTRQPTAQTRTTDSRTTVSHSPSTDTVSQTNSVPPKTETMTTRPLKTSQKLTNRPTTHASTATKKGITGTVTAASLKASTATQGASTARTTPMPTTDRPTTLFLPTTGRRDAKEHLKLLHKKGWYHVVAIVRMVYVLSARVVLHLHELLQLTTDIKVAVKTVTPGTTQEVTLAATDQTDTLAAATTVAASTLPTKKPDVDPNEGRRSSGLLHHSMPACLAITSLVLYVICY